MEKVITLGNIIIINIFIIFFSELLKKVTKIVAETVKNNLCYFDCILQEYEPIHDKVAPRQSWEVDQLLESTQSEEALRS